MTKKKKNEHPGRVYKNILFHFNLDIAKLRENRKTYFFKKYRCIRIRTSSAYLPKDRGKKYINATHCSTTFNQARKKKKKKKISLLNKNKYRKIEEH